MRLGEGEVLQERDLSGAEGSRISVVRPGGTVGEGSGKKVREISRLWRYMGGGNPDRVD